MSVPPIAYQNYKSLVGRLSKLEEAAKQTSSPINLAKINKEIASVASDLTKITDQNFSNSVSTKVKGLYTTNRNSYNLDEVLKSIQPEVTSWHTRVQNLGLDPKLADRPLVKNGEELYNLTKENAKLDNQIAYTQSVIDRQISEEGQADTDTVNELNKQQAKKNQVSEKSIPIDNIVVSQSESQGVDSATLRELDAGERIYLGVSSYDPFLISMPSDISTPKLTAGKSISVSTDLKFSGLSKTNLLDSELYDPRDVDFIIPVYRNVKERSYIYTVSYGHSLLETKASINNVSSRLPTLDNPFGINNDKRYNQFTLTNFSEEYHEKYDLNDTLGLGWIASFFGQEAEMWNLSGILYNDLFHAWYPKFRILWDNDICASKLVEKQKHLVIVIPGGSVMLECYPIGLTMSLNSDTEQVATFNMALFVKGVRNFPKVSVGFSNDGYGDTQNAMARALADMKRGIV